MHQHILMQHQQTTVDLKTTKGKLFSGMDGTIRALSVYATIDHYNAIKA